MSQPMLKENPAGGYRIIQGNPRQLNDVAEFVQVLDNLQSHRTPVVHKLFDPDREVVLSRAPGRLDVMGGIADYSGSLVLELPIAEATIVALQRDDSKMLRLVSLASDAEREVFFEMPLADLECDGTPVAYEKAREYFWAHEGSEWAAYVAGVFLVLMRERGIRFQEGCKLLISSRVPEGKGVSSSAALEVATMSAVAAAYSVPIEARDLALLCQQVENLVVGAPCGVMDQITSACGEENQLLALLCQPAEILGTIRLPEALAVWGLDSGVRHSVSGADYGSVRVGAFMGYRIIAELAGLKIERAPLAIKDDRWHGYLSNLSVSEFERLYAANLPLTITGAEFLERYQGTTDPVTRIEAERTYAVRVPTTHAVYENFRVRTFAELLRLSEVTEQERYLLGELMYQSHVSYSACGLGSSGTDELVRLVRKAGPATGLYGAKITGGGSGGTVAVLGDRDAGPSVSEIAKQYAEQTGHRPYIFSGSSPGSAQFGYLKLRRINE